MDKNSKYKEAYTQMANAHATSAHVPNMHTCNTSSRICKLCLQNIFNRQSFVDKVCLKFVQICQYVDICKLDKVCLQQY